MAEVPCPACSSNDGRRWLLDRVNSYMRIFKVASLNRPNSEAHRDQADMVIQAFKMLTGDYRVRLALQRLRSKRGGRCFICHGKGTLEYEFESGTQRKEDL